MFTHLTVLQNFRDVVYFNIVLIEYVCIFCFVIVQYDSFQQVI